MLSMLYRIDQFFAKLANWMLVILVSLIFILLFGGVIGRYIFSFTPFFTEELSRYLLIWIGAIGANIAIRNNEFMAVDVFIERLPSKYKRLLIIITSITALLFLIFLFFVSLLHAINLQSNMSATLPISMMWPTLAIPFGVILMIPHYILSVFSRNRVKL